ncbi:hypothetical protein HY045_01265 [Candidatus Woesebacteria bacterium]|nr:hypothetical protein [Candidatus Woesebacteria bacterium]
MENHTNPDNNEPQTQSSDSKGMSGGDAGSNKTEKTQPVWLNDPKLSWLIDSPDEYDSIANPDIKRMVGLLAQRQFFRPGGITTGVLDKMDDGLELLVSEGKAGLDEIEKWRSRFGKRSSELDLQEKAKQTTNQVADTLKSAAVGAVAGVTADEVAERLDALRKHLLHGKAPHKEEKRETSEGSEVKDDISTPVENETEDIQKKENFIDVQTKIMREDTPEPERKQLIEKRRKLFEEARDAGVFDAYLGVTERTIKTLKNSTWDDYDDNLETIADNLQRAADQLEVCANHPEWRGLVRAAILGVGQTTSVQGFERAKSTVSDYESWLKEHGIDIRGVELRRKVADRANFLPYEGEWADLVGKSVKKDVPPPQPTPIDHIAQARAYAEATGMETPEVQRERYERAEFYGLAIKLGYSDPVPNFLLQGKNDKAEPGVLEAISLYVAAASDCLDLRQLSGNAGVPKSLFEIKTEEQLYDFREKGMAGWLMDNLGLSHEQALSAERLAYNFFFTTNTVEEFDTKDNVVLSGNGIKDRVTNSISHLKSPAIWKAIHMQENLEEQTRKGTAWSIFGKWAVNRYQRRNQEKAKTPDVKARPEFDKKVLPSSLFKNSLRSVKINIGKDETRKMAQFVDKDGKVSLFDLLRVNGLNLYNHDLTINSVNNLEWEELDEAPLGGYYFGKIGAASLIAGLVINGRLPQDKTETDLTNAFNALEIEDEFRLKIKAAVPGEKSGLRVDKDDLTPAGTSNSTLDIYLLNPGDNYGVVLQGLRKTNVNLFNDWNYVLRNWREILRK